MIDTSIYSTENIKWIMNQVEIKAFHCVPGSEIENDRYKEHREAHIKNGCECWKPLDLPLRDKALELYEQMIEEKKIELARSPEYQAFCSHIPENVIVDEIGKNMYPEAVACSYQVRLDRQKANEERMNLILKREADNILQKKKEREEEEKKLASRSFIRRFFNL